MSEQDTIDLLKIIKTNYQHFIVNEDVVAYWFNVLKKYDRQEVLRQLDDYINSSDYKEIPKVNRLVLNLQTYEEKENNRKYDDVVVQCNLCKKWFKHKNIDLHQDRCLDLKFLEVKLHALGRPTTREKLEELSPEQIEILLNKYLPKNNNKNIIKKC